MEWSVYSPILTHNKYVEADEFIRHVRRCGITSVEIMSSELNEKTLEEFKNYYNGYDMAVTGLIIFTDFVERTASDYDAEMDRVRVLVQEAADNDIWHVMVVPDVKEVKCPDDKLAARDKIVAGMKKIVKLASKMGIVVSMENYSLHTHPYSTIDEMVYLMEHVPGLKYTLDVGNFYCVKEDVLKAYDVLKEYMIHMHVKDWKEDEFGYIIRAELQALTGCVPGTGLLPVKELLKRMKRDGYHGALLAEINVEEDVRALTKKDIEIWLHVLNEYWA